MPPAKPIRLAFNTHGLGDCVHAATALRLYIQRGYDVQIQVEDNKRWLWEAAGIPIYEGEEPLPVHPYYYPDWGKFWDLSTPDHTYSKIAHFFEVAELPKLGTKEEVWAAVCSERVDARGAVSVEVMNDVEKFLEGLPKPIVLLHSKGSNWQEKKSIPDATAFSLICELVGSFSGSIVTLDWDRRAPTLGHERVRSICPHWGHMSTEHFGALCQLSDLLIGVDSGPFHLAGWFGIPTLYVSREIPPVRCCLPSPNAIYLVPFRDHGHWEARGPEWRFAEFYGGEASARDIVMLVSEFVAGASSLKCKLNRDSSMQALDTSSIAGAYSYNRVGYDQRTIELSPDGRVGQGSAGCESSWKLEPTPIGEVITIFGDKGGPTCHLKAEEDGVFRGKWLRHEQMPIELIPQSLIDARQKPRVWSGPSAEGRYIYRRVTYDERPMELRSDGTIGEGAGGCEQRWAAKTVNGTLAIEISGKDGVICQCLSRDGMFFGNWTQFEKMPIELVPLRQIEKPKESSGQLFSTRFTTARDFRSDWYAKWKSVLSFSDRVHRKSWELAIVCETLQSHGMLKQGKKGVGFGVGSESFPRMFADMGCNILATDMLPDSWSHVTSRFHEVNVHDQILTRNVDMNWINGTDHYAAVEENEFDFSWSVCSMDHCGSTWLTKRFLLNQMNALKVGGVAIHTAEYTINLGMPRTGNTVWFTWSDILDIGHLMQSLGHQLAPIDWFIGDSLEDHMIDTHPYDKGVHIKTEALGKWGTCVSFAAKKASPNVLWIPVDEAEARKLIEGYQFSHSHT